MMIEESFHKKYIAIISIKAPNNIIPNNMKQKLRVFRGETDNM